MASIRLDGKSAIVTGGTKGIGRAIVLSLVSAGVSVVTAARHGDLSAQLKADVEKLGGKLIFVQADVSRWADCQRIASAAIDAYGKIDILVNNAGSSLPQSLAGEMSEADWRTVSGVTLDGTIFMCRAVLPAMISRRDGVILNVASTAVVQTVASMSAYAASKAAVVQFTKVVAVENVQHGIRANALLIGTTDTDLVRESLASHRAAYMAQEGAAASAGGASGEGRDLLRQVVMMPPEGVAAAVTLLCADEAREITAAEIMMDRAYTAGLGHTYFIKWAAAGILPNV